MKTLLLSILLFTLAFSAPALQRERTYIQEDGETFFATLKGDEHLHWIEDEHENIIKYNAQTQNYDYAEISKNELKASGERYSHHKKQLRGVAKSVSKDALLKLWEEKRLKKYQRKKH